MTESPGRKRAPVCLDHKDRPAVAYFRTFKMQEKVYVCHEDLLKYFGRAYPAYALDGRKILTIVAGKLIIDNK